MRLMISYFYQIRNFTENMIPLSTAIWDPKWYHDFTGDYNYIFEDKRNILNGVRLLPIIECGKASSGCHGPEQCCDKAKPPHCQFLETYRENLEHMDFNQLISDLEAFEKGYQQFKNIKDEIIMTLIVYETPSNPCSERSALIDYFKSNGYELEEFKPTIKIKKGEFVF